MKLKIIEAKIVTAKVLKNLEEMLNAFALSAVVAFSGYQAWQHHAKGVWILLAAAAIWSVYQASKAWITVLNK